MTNTPSPDEDRELIERLLDVVQELRDEDMPTRAGHVERAADRLESLLSDRAKLELQVQELEKRIWS